MCCAVADTLCQEFGIRNVNVQHIKGDPRSQHAMSKLIDLSRFNAALVICGAWQALHPLLCAFPLVVHSMLRVSQRKHFLLAIIINTEVYSPGLSHRWVAAQWCPVGPAQGVG